MIFRLYMYDCCSLCDSGFFLRDFRSADDVISYLGSKYGLKNIKITFEKHGKGFIYAGGDHYRVEYE